MITRIEAERIMAKPEYANRTPLYAYEDGNDYVINWNGKEYRQGNPFGLDSQLSQAGFPNPHNLFLVSKEEATNE